MASSLSQRLEALRVKSRMLTDRYRQANESLRQAREQIASLQAVCDKQQQQIKELRLQSEQLKVASVLSPDHRDVEAVREFLTGLVREIDKSIAQLSQ